MCAGTLEPSWVGSPVSVIPSLDDDDKEAKMSLCPLPAPSPLLMASWWEAAAAQRIVLRT